MVDDRGNPAVQIFADSDAALARMCNTAEGAGCRIVSTSGVELAVTPPAPIAPAAAVLVELEDEDRGEAALPLLDWLQHEAENGRRRGVVSAPAGLIDLVAGSVSHGDISHLCVADEAERLNAVARAVRPRNSRLREVADEPVARLLQPSTSYLTKAGSQADAALIRAMVRARRARSMHLPPDLFADPVWDMLLDLMAARIEGRKVAVSSLCAAAAVPPTTALRWIGVLSERGLVVRVADPTDGRRVHVELAEGTASGLGAWLEEARRFAAEVL